MKKLFFILTCVLALSSSAQTVSKQLKDAFQKFENNSQLSNAISSLYVINAKTGEVVFDKNSRIGLAPASTLKVVTAATGYELLGKDFRYKTEMGYTTKDLTENTICIKGYGDPTLGSVRFDHTAPEKIISSFFQSLEKSGAKNFTNSFAIDNSSFETQLIPDGWIWQDLGNYYGAGAGAVNWKENQFELVLSSSPKVGGPVQVVSLNGEKKPELNSYFSSELKSAAKGTGDSAYVYLPLGNQEYIIRGSIPVAEKDFLIKAAAYDPASYLAFDFGKYFKTHSTTHSPGTSSTLYFKGKVGDSLNVVYTHYSPSLDSIIYWFLKKSINLYGEALVKTFAYEKNGFGETGKGIEIVKNFWKGKGIAPTELNIFDGSGLSPSDRLTTHAQVIVLKYAKSQSWFKSYFDAFPEYNGMKMKSGTINGVKGFCGYQKSKNGNEYIFSFIVNNYNGSTSAVVRKMYKVLDELK